MCVYVCVYSTTGSCLCRHSPIACDGWESVQTEPTSTLAGQIGLRACVLVVDVCSLNLIHQLHVQCTVRCRVQLGLVVDNVFHLVSMLLGNEEWLVLEIV